MELLTYMFNLDTHKNGVQQILQGFETGDNISRRLVMALTEETEPVLLPQSGVTATMYTKRPAQSSPSLYSVEISGNNIIFDVPSDVLIEAGMVDMQLKLTFGANDNQMIMNAPRFQLEVWESLAQDSEAEDSQEYESLQQALARANAVYNGRITSFSFDENFVLTVQYGWDEEEETKVTYTTDIFAEAMENFTEALSEHYPTIQIGTVTDGDVTSVTNVGTEEHAIFNFVLQKGIQGEPGADGQDGEDGYSPLASVTKVGKKATITITDESGTTTAEVSDGTDGSTVSWNQIAQSGTKIAEVTIDGTKYNVYAPNTGTVVGWNQIVTSGTKIATITINGVPVDVYAPTSGGGGATTLSGLDDVQFAATPVWGETLLNDGIKWVNVENRLDNLIDVSTSGASSGDVLMSDGTDWSPQALNIPSFLNDLLDVNLDNLASGDVFMFDGSDWVNSDMPTPTVSLDQVDNPTNNKAFNIPQTKTLTVNGQTTLTDYNDSSQRYVCEYSIRDHKFSVVDVSTGVEYVTVFDKTRKEWEIGQTTAKVDVRLAGKLDFVDSYNRLLTIRADDIDFSNSGWGIGYGTLKNALTTIDNILSALRNGKADKAIVKEATLSRGSTSVTVTDDSITSSSRIDVYTDKFGLNPTGMTVSSGSITITFPAQSTSTTVKVYVYDY